MSYSRKLNIEIVEKKSDMNYDAIFSQLVMICLLPIT